MAYVQAASAPFPTQIVESIARRNANFHPSPWQDYFLTNAKTYAENVDVKIEERHQELKEQVRKVLVAATENVDHKVLLRLIDLIQRLGISYHFESEIDLALQHSYETHGNQLDHEGDLNMLALHFRLLRQQRYNISSDIFEKFKDYEGQFKKSMIEDVEGMLSLYEASYMMGHGEKILEEALEFTTNHLKSTMKSDLMSSNPQLAERVAHALEKPIRRNLNRLMARFYISWYQKGSCSYNDRLLVDFAKLDFNILQHLYQEEISDLTRWWMDLDLTTKLPFARDRMVECYFWAQAVYFEPHYSSGRKFLAKMIQILTILDDIYDTYATFEELVLLTQAIERWDEHAIDLAPEYMRVSFRALLDIYSKMEEELATEGLSFRVPYLKEEVKRLTRAYFEQARWFHESYIPTVDEYMKVAIPTSGCRLLAAIAFVSMKEQFITEEVFEWTSNTDCIPLLLEATCVITRLKNDMMGHETEQERGHQPSFVECYVKEHGVTKEEAYTVIRKEVEDAWKNVNMECFRPTAMPMPILERPLNVARSMEVYYRDIDGFTNSKTRIKEMIASLIINSV